MISECTVGEAMVAALARTVADGTLVFHGYGSPLVQLALHLAKRTHAPNAVLVAGATYGVDPDPPFLTPTTNDWVMDRGAVCHLDIEELFDLGASGRLDQMFLSGLQIDAWGSCNVNLLGTPDALKLKLPGGGGGCNLSCTVGKVTLWTTAHRAVGGRFRLVDRCAFVTSLGHRAAGGVPRSELGYPGGPDQLVTELGVFDFGADGHARLVGTWPDVDVDEVRQSTGFELKLAPSVSALPLPSREEVAILRRLDPMGIHTRELRAADRGRVFGVGRA